MTRRDDYPEFLPPQDADLPRPAGPEPEPQTGLPLPAAQGSRKTTALKVSLLVAVPLLAITLVVLIVIAATSLGGSLNKPTAAKPTGVPTPSRPATTTDPPTPTPSASKPPTKPVVSGWQPVVQAERGVAYDVPRGWNVNTPTTLVGFDNTGGSRLTMTGSAQYAEGYCTDSHSGLWRGVSGVAPAPKGGSPSAAAKVAASSWGNVYDEPSEGVHATASAGPVDKMRVKGARAYHTRVNVRVTGGNACTPPRALVDIVAVRGAHSNGVFVLVADQGNQPDEDRATLNKIVSTVRVYKK